MILRAATLAFALLVPSFGLSQTAKAPGALLRGLDKVSGAHEDLNLRAGETALLGKLQITLGECRYPTDNPSGDAFAWLVIRDGNSEVTSFEGWMVASSPALNGFDHQRYDVWVLRCITE
ncbi:DUF2155 domain-containing protein [Aliiroseovarius sp. KMU-50]|uniref:DUF2155 domain-containing protein n=1 Tax=Aliiroseovarius salicola TaxID=3009082 RepID=A0ABT4W104_9RHOB|nr:DUF2155 domain-containing protein [Aliiroseovarius sp. KMU-50]MDA5094186.1 DUF2155 domain-containing protein [Aliiroseovarius sp. KMU-50]